MCKDKKTQDYKGLSAAKVFANPPRDAYVSSNLLRRLCNICLLLGVLFRKLRLRDSRSNSSPVTMRVCPSP